MAINPGVISSVPMPDPQVILVSGGRLCISSYGWVHWEGSEFASIAHVLAYEKAKFFGNRTLMAKVLKTSYHRVSILEREFAKMPNYDETTWIMQLPALLEKIILKRYLHLYQPLIELNTTKSITLGLSTRDKVLGIGLVNYDRDALDPTKWTGMNMYGQALMEVRRYIRDKDRLVEDGLYESVRLILRN